jgi:hypothetical protein
MDSRVRLVAITSLQPAHTELAAVDTMEGIQGIFRSGIVTKPVTFLLLKDLDRFQNPVGFGTGPSGLEFIKLPD